MKLFALSWLVIASWFITTAQAENELTVPGFTAYQVYDQHSETPKDNDSLLRVMWFGEFKHTGAINSSVKLHLAAGQSARLRLTVGNQSADAVVSGNNDPLVVPFGNLEITNQGYQRFMLECLNNTNLQPADVDSLLLSGDAVAGAHFNLKSRINAASVHLTYPTDGFTNIDAFYCEATGVEDPLWTYYMACGWHRGYFGMQVNSPTERRIIFSVWDSGNEAVDRTKVASENRTTLLAKGDGVDAGGFGNEGTGGHSHLVYNWKTGEKQRFLVTAKPVDGTFTIYSGYFYRSDLNQWMLISSWKAPRDGTYLSGLYSFNEDFVGENGYLRRKALFGNQWIHTADGQWHEITTAKFSHDGTGRADRLDRFMGVEDGQFFLSNGGFIPGFTTFGDPFTRPATGQPPADIPPAFLP